MRRTLYALKKALGDEFLDVNRETVGLNKGADIWLDVGQFNSHVHECLGHGHPATAVCLSCHAALKAATANYRDDFLSGFSLKDSVNFDDWQFFQADALVVGRLFDPSMIPEEERFDPEKLVIESRQGGTAAVHIEDVDDIVKHVVAEARPGDVVVVLSSGSFDGLHDRLLVGLGDAIMPAVARDMGEIRALLEETRLCDDQTERSESCSFLVLRNETGFVGCVCLEVFGEEAILRSLAVNKAARGVGYGWMLADNAINLARHRGVLRIYLLTETASDFFAAKHGFRVVMPSTISADVADSKTFRNCPIGAVTMRLDL